jgi:hypothetical protein
METGFVSRAKRNQYFWDVVSAFWYYFLISGFLLLIYLFSHEQCSDGERYEGMVSSWDRRLEEFKISLDCGEFDVGPP